MTQLGELAKLLDSIGAGRGDGTAEKTIQPPVLGGEVRAAGPRRAEPGLQSGSHPDPGALPPGPSPAPVYPHRAPRAAWPEGWPGSAPVSARAWASSVLPVSGAASSGKVSDASPSFGAP